MNIQLYNFDIHYRSIFIIHDYEHEETLLYLFVSYLLLKNISTVFPYNFNIHYENATKTKLYDLISHQYLISRNYYIMSKIHSYIFLLVYLGKIFAKNIANTRFNASMM